MTTKITKKFTKMVCLHLVKHKKKFENVTTQKPEANIFV